MRRHHAQNSANNLRGGVGRRLRRAQVFAYCEYKRDRRVEMSAGNRAEYGDQHNKDGSCRQRVAQQLQCRILRQRFRHNAGPNDGSGQNGCAQSFCETAARKIEAFHQVAFAFGALKAASSAMTGPQSSALPPQQSVSRKAARPRRRSRLAR